MLGLHSRKLLLLSPTLGKEVVVLFSSYEIVFNIGPAQISALHGQFLIDLPFTYYNLISCNILVDIPLTYSMEWQTVYLGSYFYPGPGATLMSVMAVLM